MTSSEIIALIISLYCSFRMTKDLFSSQIIRYSSLFKIATLGSNVFLLYTSIILELK